MQNKHIAQFDDFMKVKLNEVEMDVFMAQKGFEQFLAAQKKPSRNKRFLWLFLLLLLVPASFIFFFKNNSKQAIPASGHSGTGTKPAAVQQATVTVPGNNMRSNENNTRPLKDELPGTPGAAIKNKQEVVTVRENSVPATNPLTGNKLVMPDTGSVITSTVLEAGSTSGNKPVPFKKDSVQSKTIAPQKEDSFYIVW